jgi:thioredoxin reductase (NADPH)
MLERAREVANIEWVTPYVVQEFAAGQNGSLGTVRLRNVEDGSERLLEVGGTFIAIGHEPQSQLVRGQVELDAAGYVVTQGRSTLTNLAGVFAAGDLVDHTYRQAVTAAGSGCQAALDAEWFLRDAGPLPDAELAAALRA